MAEPRSQQGRAVLATVRELDHPGADLVFQHVRKTLPRISLGTIYRNLDLLVRQGHIRRRDIGGTSRYDDNTTQHLHLHDTSTDQLRDLPISAGLQAELQTICDEHFQGNADCVIELKGILRP